MRTRSAFVSNSSSSSFILDFEKPISSRADLEEILLPDSNVYVGPYNHNFSKKEVIDYIQDDLKPISKEDVVTQLARNYEIFEKIFKFPDWYSINKNPLEDYCRRTFVTPTNLAVNMSWYDYREYLQKQYVSKHYKNKLKTLKNPYFIEVEDQSSLGSAIEYGDLFDDVLIDRISNH